MGINGANGANGTNGTNGREGTHRTYKSYKSCQLRVGVGLSIGLIWPISPIILLFFQGFFVILQLEITRKQHAGH